MTEYLDRPDGDGFWEWSPAPDAHDRWYPAIVRGKARSIAYETMICSSNLPEIGKWRRPQFIGQWQDGPPDREGHWLVSHDTFDLEHRQATMTDGTLRIHCAGEHSYRGLPVKGCDGIIGSLFLGNLPDPPKDEPEPEKQTPQYVEGTYYVRIDGM